MKYVLILFFCAITCGAYAQHHKKPHVKAELKYYLQRHDVKDEGFDMVARYAVEGDSAIAAFKPKGKITPFGMFVRWKDFPREGTCLVKDKKGRFVMGTFQADTLVSGIRIDSVGTYAGQFNSEMEASGHGSYLHADNTFYEGHWENATVSASASTRTT